MLFPEEGIISGNPGKAVFTRKSIKNIMKGIYKFDISFDILSHQTIKKIPENPGGLKVRSVNICKKTLLFKSKVTYSLITALNIKNVIQKALDQLKISDFSLSAKNTRFHDKQIHNNHRNILGC